MRSAFRAVLFDFDYTLADSSDAVIDCFNLGLRGIGLPDASPQAIRRTIGLSIPASLAAVAGERSRAEVAEFRAHWRRRSAEIMTERTRIYGCVPGVLEALREAGIVLGVVSTKYRGRIEEVFRRDGLGERFEAIVGGDDVAEPKPHPESLLKGLERLGAQPAEALYVGDSLTDAETARRAGAAFAAVLSGTTLREEFSGYEPWRILESVADLPAALSVRGAG